MQRHFKSPSCPFACGNVQGPLMLPVLWPADGCRQLRRHRALQSGRTGADVRGHAERAVTTPLPRLPTTVSAAAVNAVSHSQYVRPCQSTVEVHSCSVFSQCSSGYWIEEGKLPSSRYTRKKNLRPNSKPGKRNNTRFAGLLGLCRSNAPRRCFAVVLLVSALALCHPL